MKEEVRGGGNGGRAAGGVRFWRSNLDGASAAHNTQCLTRFLAEGLFVEEDIRVPLGATGCLLLNIPKITCMWGFCKGTVNWPPLVPDADELSKMLLKHVVEERVGVRVRVAERLQLLVPVVPEVR